MIDERLVESSGEVMEDHVNVAGRGDDADACSPAVSHLIPEFGY